MIKENITLDEVLSFLNELTELDPNMITNWINARVVCNEAIYNHPTVQCGTWNGEKKVGALGILNGLFGSFDEGPKKGWGTITAVIEKDDLVSGFKRTENECKEGA
jgi:hypothetical protein